MKNDHRLLKVMVEEGPTIAKWLRPLSASAARFREKENEILNNPNADLPAAVRTITDNAYDKLLKRYTPAQREQAKAGYEKAREFIRRFVEAGGALKEGSDPPRGLAQHVAVAQRRALRLHLRLDLSRRERVAMDDVQGRIDSRGIALDEAGVTDLRYPIVILDRAHEKQHAKHGQRDEKREREAGEEFHWGSSREMTTIDQVEARFASLKKKLMLKPKIVAYWNASERVRIGNFGFSNKFQENISFI